MGQTRRRGTHRSRVADNGDLLVAVQLPIVYGHRLFNHLLDIGKLSGTGRPRLLVAAVVNDDDFDRPRRHRGRAVRK